MIVEADLSTIRRKVSSLAARHEIARTEAIRLASTVDTLTASVVEQEQVLKLIQGFADRLQAVVQEDVSKFVTEGVKAVFGQDKVFKLEFGLRSNQIVASMTLNDLPLNSQAGVFAQSGGVLHVVAYLLRLWVILRLSQLVGVSRVIFLDEPFGWVSPEYLPKVTELMGGMARQLGVQHIYITREPLLIAGADPVYEFNKVLEVGSELYEAVAQLESSEN